ncbi:MAG TPA: hypothetical protein VFG72_00250 [Marmoricola sp.]|nr:hypothetical protein [Marmoricola sp.]
MGYTTDFIGHIDIDPPLNIDEERYLLAFARSRHFDREEGPYAVDANPAAASSDGVPTERYNRSGPGQPGLWCGWEPCWDGCCISHDGMEKFYASVRWLEYLIDHFLRPGAVAADSPLPYFEGFTFDHRLDGIVAACRRDNKELYVIRVDDNKVCEEVLRPADLRYVDFPPLPYEAAIDRERERSRRRRRSAGR